MSHRKALWTFWSVDYNQDSRVEYISNYSSFDRALLSSMRGSATNIWDPIYYMLNELICVGIRYFKLFKKRIRSFLCQLTFRRFFESLMQIWKKYDLESNFGGQVCALQKYFPIPFLFSKKTDRKYPHLKGANISHQICLGGKCEKICCKNIENPKLDPPPLLMMLWVLWQLLQIGLVSADEKWFCS